MLTLAYFYEIQMPFLKSASKPQSHIQCTAKHIFLRATLAISEYQKVSYACCQTWNL